MSSTGLRPPGPRHHPRHREAAVEAEAGVEAGVEVEDAVGPRPAGMVVVVGAMTTMEARPAAVAVVVAVAVAAVDAVAVAVVVAVGVAHPLDGRA